MSQQQQQHGNDRSQLMRSLLDEIDDIEDIDADDVKTEVSLSPAGSEADLRRDTLALVHDHNSAAADVGAGIIMSSSSSSSSNIESNECGFWKFKPKMLQSLNQFELFLVLLAISGFCTGIQGALKSALLTKLEKRFNFDSKTSSLIMSANDMVFLPSVMLVSYFGSLGHRPRLLALSCFGYGFASLLFSLPHFIFGSLSNSGGGGNIMGRLGYSCDNASHATVDSDIAVSDFESKLSLAIFMISGFIEGISAAPYWNLGVAFVDDVTGEMSGVFIGLIIAARILSPSIGYQLYGKIFVHITEEGRPAEPSQLSHPRYVPAWWLGFMCVGTLAIMTSLPMALFPAKPNFNGDKYTGGKGGVWKLFKKLNRKAEKRRRSSIAQGLTTDTEEAALSLHGFFTAIKRLLSNPIYICLLCGNMFEFMEINCVIAYMAKYLELHFRIGSGDAAMLTGLALPGANAAGIIVSSIIASQVAWRVPQLARFHAIVNTFGIVAAAIGFLFVCPTVQFHGGLLHSGPTFAAESCKATEVTAAAAAAAIPTSAAAWINNNSSSSSSGSCSCNSLSFAPICINRTNYFNPCSGNCAFSKGHISCGCSAEDKFPMKDFRQRVGQLCPADCSTTVYLFIALYFIIKLIRLSARSQEAVLQMRCVRQKDKALGLGVNSFMFSIGGIWVPTFVGYLFDKSCIFRNPSIEDATSKKACLFYDAQRFRYSFVGFTTAALIPACVAFYLAWYFTVRDPKLADLDEVLTATVEVKMSDGLGDQIDKREGGKEEDGV